MPVSTPVSPNQKPQFGLARIDPGLSTGLVGAWLCNEAAGPAYSLINPQDQLALSSGGTWANTAAALSITGTAATSGAKLGSPSASLKPAVAVTLFWYGTFQGARSAGANNPRIASMEYDLGNNSPFICYGFYRPSSDQTEIDFAWNNGSFQSIAVSSAVDSANYGRIQSVGFAMDNVSARVFVDGIFKSSSASGVGAMTYAADSAFVVGGHLSGTDYPNTTTSALYVWNRKLADSDMLRLHTEPYAMIQTRPMRRWARPFAAVAQTPYNPWLQRAPILAS